MSGSIVKKAHPAGSDNPASPLTELTAGLRRRLAGLVTGTLLSMVSLRRAPAPSPYALLAPDQLPPTHDSGGSRGQVLMGVTIEASLTSQRMELNSRVQSFSVQETTEATVFSIRLENGRQIEIHMEPGAIQTVYLIQPDNSIQSVDPHDIDRYLNGELLRMFSLSVADAGNGPTPPRNSMTMDQITFERADGVTLIVCVRPGSIKKFES